MSRRQMTEDQKQTADMLRDMFTAKWGFGDPPPAYRTEYENDLDAVQWAGRIGAYR